jgi:hypothetical protein
VGHASCRTLVCRTVFRGSALRVGPVCAIAKAKHAHRLDGRLRQGAVAR